jgi:SAGA-associated factor 29
MSRSNEKDSLAASTSHATQGTFVPSSSLGHSGLSAFSAADASLISEKLKTLHSNVKDVQKERENSELNLKNIAKTHEKLQNEPGKPYFKHKLKGLYRSALHDCETEADSLQKCLDTIRDIRTTVRNRPRKTGLFSKETSIRRGALMKMLQSVAQTMPLFIPRSRKEPIPTLCGCIPADSSYLAKQGDLVAALIKPAGDQPTTGDESNWILAEVVRFNHSINKYEIDDIDEEQKEKHLLSRRRVVPLPLMRANPETNPEAIFEKGALVLALYPQTTCFYRGVIGKRPETGHEDYLVLFEDSSYPEGYSPALPVPQRYVIVCKDVKKK